MKFKLGDRVAVYATLNGTMVRSLGSITAIVRDADDVNFGRLSVQMDKPITGNYIFAHPKQCRKIKTDAFWFNKTTMDIALAPQESCGWVRYVKSKRQ